MEKTNETINNVLLIRMLSKKGYREKIIKMITGLNQSYINKIANYKLYKDIDVLDGEEIDMTKEQRDRLNAANRILQCQELQVNDLEQDIMYMQLLRFFLIEKEDIYNLYGHLAKSKINRYLLKKDIDILNFNSELIGVPREIYLDLIIDYFIES